jgi:hypothetical protein
MATYFLANRFMAHLIVYVSETPAAIDASAGVPQTWRTAATAPGPNRAARSISGQFSLNQATVACIPVSNEVLGW